MSMTGQRLTADEFIAMPEGDRRYWLIDGEIVVNEAAWPHQRATGLIHSRLLTWSEAGPGRGTVGMPVDVRLDEANVFAPDVWWLADEHRHRLDRGYLVGPPDLAVEVRSPSTWRYDRGIKRATYERAGLAELWLVDPVARTVLALRRSTAEATEFDQEVTLEAADRLTSPMLPGFEAAVADVLRPG